MLYLPSFGYRVLDRAILLLGSATKEGLGLTLNPKPTFSFPRSAGSQPPESDGLGELPQGPWTGFKKVEGSGFTGYRFYGL